MSFLSLRSAQAYTFRHSGRGVREVKARNSAMSRGLAVLVSILVFWHSGLADIGHIYATYDDNEFRVI
jgi:hypothetical protein